MSAVTRLVGSKGQLYVYLPDLHAKKKNGSAIGGYMVGKQIWRI